MKNKRFNIVLLIVLLAVVVGAGVFAAFKLLNKPAEPVVEEKESKTVQLLAFDSYAELTGTKIRLENSFGKIDVNTDKKYITEGKGSMAIFPQGDYTRIGWNPYMQLDCLNTTFATNDFTELESITMDVYNDSDEEREIAINFTVANYSENFLTTPSVTFTLAPNTWTECTYKISEQIVASYFNLANVRYMTIVFPDHKEAKDDVVEALYFDNLYGTKYDVAPEVSQLDYNFFDGIGFEDIAEQYLVSGETAATNRMTFERTTYEKAGLEAREGFGEYLMSAEATGSTWPSFLIHYGEDVKKGTILTFWAYIDVDNEESDKYIIQSQTNAHGYDRVPNTVAAGENPFNEWFQVKILLEGNSDVTYTHFNFDDFETEEGITRFGSKPVKIYIDNIQLKEAAAAVNIDDNGNITLRNPLGTTTISYDVDQPFKKGETIAFDIDFNTKEEVSIWVLADGKWNDGTEINEFHAMNYKTWEGKRTIMAEAKKDISSFTIVVKYFGKNNLETNICTISNIRKAASRAQVQANGDVIIKNPAGDARYVYDFTRPVKKGQRIAFDIDFNTSEAVAVWLLAEGKWNSETDKTNEWHAYGYDKWDGKKTIVVEATRDISFFSIGHEYRGKEDYKKNVCTISNVRILNPDAVVNKDGSVTLSNQLGGPTVFYDVKLPVKSDEMIRMDLDFNSTEPVTVWVMAEGEWNSETDKSNEWYAYAFEKWDGRRQITAKATKNADWFRVYVKYGGDTDPAKKVCTISNIGIEKFVPSVEVDGQGNVTLNNKFETAKSVSYTINSPAKKDGTLKFDIDFNNADPVGIWVLADGKWNEGTEVNEFYAYGYDSWEGPKTIEVPIIHDADSLQIYVQYRGEESAWVNNVCTITNIHLYEPDVTEEVDGTVTLRNKDGNNKVYYDIEGALIAGSRLVFDVDFNVDEALAIWVLADGKWNQDAEVNELYVYGYDEWTQQRTISVDVTKAVSKLQVVVEYRGTEPHTQKVCTLTNIKTSEPDIIEKPDGSVTIRNSAGANRVTYDVEQDLTKGSKFSFDIDFTGETQVAIWVQGITASANPEWHGADHSPWSQPKNIEVTADRDVDKVRILVEYRGSEPHTEKVTTISNIQVTEPGVTVGPDGTVTIRNSAGSNRVIYDVEQALTKDSKFSFDIDFIGETQVAIWVQGITASANPEWHGADHSPWSQSKNIEVTADRDVDKVRIIVEYRGSEPHTEKVTTISNIKTDEPDITVAEDGTVTIRNSEGTKRVVYDVEQTVAKNEKFTFDINISGDTQVAIWVQGITASSNPEWHGADHSPWSQKKNITVTATENVNKVRIIVEYRGTEPHTGKVTTISNITTLKANEFIITGGTVNKRTNDWMFFLNTSSSFTGNTAWLGNCNHLKIANASSTNNSGWCDFYSIADGRLGVVMTPGQGLPAAADGYTVTFPAGMTVTYNSVTYTLKADAVFKCNGTTWTKQ